MNTRTALTEPVVKAHRCPDDKHQSIIWDSKVRGLGVRAVRDHFDAAGARVPGAKTYVFQGSVKGAHVARRITIGRCDALPLVGNPTHADEAMHGARYRAQVLRNMMDAGRDPVAEAAQDAANKAEAAARKTATAVTLRQVVEHYIANKKTRNGPLKANTVRDIRKHLDRAFAAWADKPIASITRDACERRHKELATSGLTGERPAPAQARQAFTVLRALITWAMEKFRAGELPLITENPVGILKGQMAPPRARNIRVPMERVGHVWEALRAVREDPAQLPATHTQADALAFMLVTGARTDETLSLTWDRVVLDEDAGTWHLPDPKNGRACTYPLNKPARELLAARPRRKGCPYVFAARGGKGHAGTPRGPAMEVIIAAAGCHQNRHSLRATFTNIARNVLRIDSGDVELITGHVPTTVVDRHYRDTSDLRWAAPELERIGAWVLAQADAAAGRNVVAMPSRKRA